MKIGCWAILWVNVDTGRIAGGGLYSERYPTHDFAEMAVEVTHVERSTFEHAKVLVIRHLKDRCPEVYKLYFKEE
jgi:hypothetical protein